MPVPVELDAVTTPELRRLTTLYLALGPARLVLDMSRTTFVDSHGIGALLALARRARDLGIAFELRGVRPAPAQALRASGVDRVLPFEAE